MIHSDRKYNVVSSNGKSSIILGSMLKFALRTGADIVSWEEVK